MTDFTKIKSKYVKNKLKSLEMTSENMNHIDDLMKIESYFLGTLGGCAGFSPYVLVERRLAKIYSKEWTAIQRELNPDYLERKKKQKQEEEEEKRKERLKELVEEKKEMELSLKSWNTMKKR